MKNEHSRDNILAALQWLVSNAQDGEVLYWHFSGHGGQVESKIQKKREGDDKDIDECILPVDAKSGGVNYIRDKDIYEIIKVLEQRPLVNLTVVFDSCHSAGGVKENNPGSKVQLRFWDYKGAPRAIGSLDAAFSHMQTLSKDEAEPPTCVLLAGCQSWDGSADYPFGKGNLGALTKFMCDCLQDRLEWGYKDLADTIYDRMQDFREPGRTRSPFHQVPTICALKWRQSCVFLQPFTKEHIKKSVHESSIGIVETSLRKQPETPIGPIINTLKTIQPELAQANAGSITQELKEQNITTAFDLANANQETLAPLGALATLFFQFGQSIRTGITVRNTCPDTIQVSISTELLTDDGSFNDVPPNATDLSKYRWGRKAGPYIVAVRVSGQEFRFTLIKGGEEVNLVISGFKQVKATNSAGSELRLDFL